jgi:hypothetical protein
MQKLCFVSLMILFISPGLSAADVPEALPESVSVQLRLPLSEVGSGTYHKFGFSVYRATLWAPDGVWDATKPYALQLHYMRDVSKQTLVDTVSDDIREQEVADEVTLARWEEILNAELPAVSDGDTIIAVAMPGKKSLVFYNSKKIFNIDDPAFSKAFFNIWLGERADDSLRAKLLGRP